MSKAVLLSNKLLRCLVLLSSLFFIDQSMALDNNEKTKEKSAAKLNDIQQAIAQQESTIIKANQALSLIHI